MRRKASPRRHEVGRTCARRAAAVRPEVRPLVRRDCRSRKIIFAEKCQVESEEWWKEHGRMVEVVVQCTHPRQDFNYPPYAAKSKVYRVRVDPRSKTYRQRELDQALPKIQDALLAGQDVIFHCMQSFHRAPVTAAAAYRRVTGGSASVHTCCMTAVVAATSQIKYFLVWFYYVFFTVNLPLLLMLLLLPRHRRCWWCCCCGCWCCCCSWFRF